MLYDGGGQPIRDGLVETWQADDSGRYPHSDNGTRQESDPEFFGYGWSRTEGDGRFRFDSIKPGSVAAPDGRFQAPHVLVSVMARGILTRYITRMYFEDEAANESDPILERVPAARRQTLVARRVADGTYQFDIRVQGPDETVFFDV